MIDGLAMSRYCANNTTTAIEVCAFTYSPSFAFLPSSNGSVTTYSKNGAPAATNHQKPAACAYQKAGTIDAAIRAPRLIVSRIRSAPYFRFHLYSRMWAAEIGTLIGRKIKNSDYQALLLRPQLDSRMGSKVHPL